jgi:hypothetical protein
VIARHHRRVGRVPLVRSGTAGSLRARSGLFGESNSTKRHGQRQHERRDQQRNALAHLGFLSSILPMYSASRIDSDSATSVGLTSFPFIQKENRPTSPLGVGSRLRYWLHPSLTSAHLWERASKPLHFELGCSLPNPTIAPVRAQRKGMN